MFSKHIGSYSLIKTLVSAEGLNINSTGSGTLIGSNHCVRTLTFFSTKTFSTRLVVTN
jgi:hypothetical protein